MSISSHLLHFVSGRLVLLPRSLKYFLQLPCLVLICSWGMTMGPQLFVHILPLLMDDFSFHYLLLPKLRISQSIMKHSTSRVESFLLTDKIILTLKPFWLPDWNHPTKDVLLELPRVQRLSIKFIDTVYLSIQN